MYRIHRSNLTERLWRTGFDLIEVSIANKVNKTFSSASLR